MLTPDLIEAKYLEEYKIFLKFADGLERTVDFKEELDDEIFEPLKDKDYFRDFVVKSEFGTIEWRNGADFSPEFLYGI